MARADLARRIDAAMAEAEARERRLREAVDTWAMCCCEEEPCVLMAALDGNET